MAGRGTGEPGELLRQLPARSAALFAWCCDVGAAIVAREAENSMNVTAVRAHGPTVHSSPSPPYALTSPRPHIPHALSPPRPHTPTPSPPHALTPPRPLAGGRSAVPGLVRPPPNEQALWRVRKAMVDAGW